MNETKSPFASKINWAAIVALVGTLLTTFGIDIDPDTRAAIVSILVSATSIGTIVFRTWFTAKTIKVGKDAG